MLLCFPPPPTHQAPSISETSNNSPINKMKYTAAILLSFAVVAFADRMGAPTAVPTAVPTTPEPTPVPAMMNGAAIQFNSGASMASGNNAVAVGADKDSGAAAAAGEDVAAAAAGPGFGVGIAASSPDM
ncbi:unnamed protein product [Agarophyton chilense]|eukprot:gb/GEZJ01004230.1/.p2 GENE.gb/GEZJ01004230.1/~~gb/GEZJ01004230.1/.p2  ORF type:complete len:129 (-),score=26.11 gb/GEZJ01004230.1/:130-516(-)